MKTFARPEASVWRLPSVHVRPAAPYPPALSCLNPLPRSAVPLEYARCAKQCWAEGAPGWRQLCSCWDREQAAPVDADVPVMQQRRWPVQVDNS